MRIVGLSLVLVLSLASDLAAAPVLERVVMVSRHGVRSPIRSVAVLESLTKRGWPAWPVGPGEMTEHGAKNLALMGEYLRGVYVAAGVLPAQGCPAKGALEVWADVADHRTRQSGEILADRLAPGCAVPAPHAADGTIDPLFDATKTSACPVGALAAGRVLLDATRPDRDLVRPEDRQALEVMQDILAPDACKAGGQLASASVCLVPPVDASGLKAAAQLSLGSTIAEGIYLEYVQGFPPADVGWGKAGSPETIAAIIPAHEHGIGILRRTPLLAARRGAVMAQTILALLDGRTLPAGAPPLSPDSKVVMIAGHDSNLLYMAGVMGLDWHLPNQPSITAPDTTLAFEVWRDTVSNQKTLRIVVYAQTLAQLREGTPLDATHLPDVVPIVPDACAGASKGCALATFSADVTHRLASLCSG